MAPSVSTMSLHPHLRMMSNIVAYVTHAGSMRNVAPYFFLDALCETILLVKDKVPCLYIWSTFYFYYCYTNQDKLENFFGEQRAHNGATTNPTIMQTGTNHICIFTWLLSVSLYQEISGNLYKDISFAHHTSIWQHFCHICLILEHATLGIVHMQEYKRSKGNCTELRQPSPNC